VIGHGEGPGKLSASCLKIGEKFRLFRIRKVSWTDARLRMADGVGIARAQFFKRRAARSIVRRRKRLQFGSAFLAAHLSVNRRHFDFAGVFDLGNSRKPLNLASDPYSRVHDTTGNRIRIAAEDRSNRPDINLRILGLTLPIAAEENPRAFARDLWRTKFQLRGGLAQR